MYLTVGHLVVITAIAIPLHSPAAQLYNGGAHIHTLYTKRSDRNATIVGTYREQNRSL